MKTLIILDMHEEFLKEKKTDETKENILQLGKLFKKEKLPIILVEDSQCNNLDKDILKLSDLIIKKNTPSAFFKTDLNKVLQDQCTTEIILVGFNIEYCILFTSIVAFELGYKVYMIEDACGTVNNEETYEMPGLDINDFIGSILNWSKVIEVPYLKEYLEYHEESKKI